MDDTEPTKSETAPFDSIRAQFPEQDENGIDLSLLRANRRLTPTERLEKHQRALTLVLEVRRAGKQAGLFRDSQGSKTKS